jgi:MFS family permease
MGFLGRISYEMIRSPISALYAKYIGAPTGMIGVLVAAVTITGVFIKFPAGAVADQWGARRVMFVGLLVKATAPFLYLIAWSWPVLFGVRLYHGFSSALFAPAAAAQVARLYPGERGLRLGIYGAAEHAGVVLGPLLGAFVLSRTNFPAAFVWAGAIGVAALLVILLVPKDPPPHVERTVAKVVQNLAVRLVLTASNPAILMVCFVEATLFAGVGTMQAYLPLYEHSIHIPIVQIGMIHAGQGLASIVTRPFVGLAGDRYGRRPFILIGMAISAGVLVVTPHMRDIGSLIGLEILFGIGAGLVTPSTTAMVGDLVEHDEFGAAMGAFGSLADVGHAFGPLVAGMLIALLGYSIGFAMVAALIVMASLIFILGSRVFAQNPPGAAL